MHNLACQNTALNWDSGLQFSLGDWASQAAPTPASLMELNQEVIAKSCQLLPSGGITAAGYKHDRMHTFHEHRFSCSGLGRAPGQFLHSVQTEYLCIQTDPITHRLSLSDCLTHSLGRRNLVSNAVLSISSVKIPKPALIICSFGYFICLFLILLMTFPHSIDKMLPLNSPCVAV